MLVKCAIHSGHVYKFDIFVGEKYCEVKWYITGLDKITVKDQMCTFIDKTV